MNKRENLIEQMMIWINTEGLSNHTIAVSCADVAERHHTEQLRLNRVGVSFGERHAKCLGFETEDIGWGVDHDCGYKTTIDCDECKYGGGRKNPEAKVNQH